eukprot:585023-Rhodomonas_salina.2
MAACSAGRNVGARWQKVSPALSMSASSSVGGTSTSAFPSACGNPAHAGYTAKSNTATRSLWRLHQECTPLSLISQCRSEEHPRLEEEGEDGIARGQRERGFGERGGEGESERGSVQGEREASRERERRACSSPS